MNKKFGWLFTFTYIYIFIFCLLCIKISFTNNNVLKCIVSIVQYIIVLQNILLNINDIVLFYINNIYNLVTGL